MCITLVSCGGGGSITRPTDGAVSQEIDRPCPATDAEDRTEVTQVRANLLLGYTEADAERCATVLGWAYRVGMRDGEAFAVTMDYSPQRVTVTIEADRVTAIVVG